MNYVYITSREPVVEHISVCIKERLGRGEKVVWLVSGGSAMAVAVGVSAALSGTPLQNLTCMLTDERYGESGHADSNWAQLQTLGFTLPGARTMPVLAGKTIQKTTEAFDASLQKELDTCGYAIGLFGMGADGHTAGILPASPAVSSSSFAVSFSAHDYERITMTPQAIGKLDEAVLYAVGEQKKSQLEKLQSNLPVDEQPAQVLKQIASFYVYNDYKGDEL